MSSDSQEALRLVWFRGDLNQGPPVPQPDGHWLLLNGSPAKGRCKSLSLGSSDPDGAGVSLH